MDDKKDLINLDETRQSLESTQKTATDIGERVKEVAYMSDKVNHDRMITEILNDKKLSTARKPMQKLMVRCRTSRQRILSWQLLDGACSSESAWLADMLYLSRQRGGPLSRME